MVGKGVSHGYSVCVCVCENEFDVTGSGGGLNGRAMFGRAFHLFMPIYISHVGTQYTM